MDHPLKKSVHQACLLQQFTGTLGNGYSDRSESAVGLLTHDAARRFRLRTDFESLHRTQSAADLAHWIPEGPAVDILFVNLYSQNHV